MKDWTRKIGAAAAAVALAGFSPARAQQNPGHVTETPQAGFVLKVHSELVLTNVVARNAKTGELIHDLKPSDFRVWENGKEQKISSFDFLNVEKAAPLSEATVSGLAGSLKKTEGAVARPEDLRNHRLIVMFFDLTSMQPEDLDRAVDAAKDFLKTRMQPADLVALISLDNTLKVDQDFTTDKNALIRRVGAYNDSEEEGFAAGATEDSNQEEDMTDYTPDESEYNDLNTDRELFALRTIAKSLERITEKKSLLYFSGGISRDGIENQASLRATINAAVRANLAIYSVDTRGLEAVGPLGHASKGSLRAGSANGAALQHSMNANFASQEVMATLSSDTGGKAFFDSNDFAPAFAQVQKDTSEYYALGFHAQNQMRDGRYRKLKIAVNRPGIKLEYRPGYYAPADFEHSNRDDREQGLEEQLASDLPATDMAVYMDTFYFRQDQDHYYMPVSLIVPGSQIPFVKGGDKDKATLDILGGVIDGFKRPVGRARETVKLNLNADLNARQKNIQYTTAFTLLPGKYKLKFVIRENQTGSMGSFEAEIVLPDLKKMPLKMSSVLLASAKHPTKRTSPLVHGGQEYVPNISHVFLRNQHLYLLYEVYSPAHLKSSEAKESGGPLRLLGSLAFFKGSAKVFETPIVEAKNINVEGRDAVAVELDVPLDALKQGPYLCQLNVIDDVSGSFSFPRFSILVKDPPPPPAATPQPTDAAPAPAAGQ